MIRLASLLLAALATACSSSSSSGGAAPCTAGAQVACACPGGVQGAQACNGEGSGFGACDCSGGAGGSSGAAGAGGSSGAAGAGGSSGAAGAGGGAAARPAGAVHFKIGRAMSDAYVCPRGGEGSVGSVDGSKATEVTDGDAGATVACSVVSSAGGFLFTGTIVQNQTNFAISGMLAGSTGTGSVTVQTPTIAEPLLSAGSARCTVTIDPADGADLSVAAGRIHAGFSCPLLQDPQSPNPDTEGCGILGIPVAGMTPPGGFLAFDGCDR